MYIFRPHVPRYIQATSKEMVFDFFDDMILHELFSSHSSEKDFSHFAISDGFVLAIFDNGFRWVVVGKISENAHEHFPVWEGEKYRALMPDGIIEVLRNEVISVRGTTLFLEDGTTAVYLRTMDDVLNVIENAQD